MEDLNFSVGSESESGAAGAEVVGHGGDEADPALVSLKLPRLLVGNQELNERFLYSYLYCIVWYFYSLH